MAAANKPIRIHHEMMQAGQRNIFIMSPLKKTNQNEEGDCILLLFFFLRSSDSCQFQHCVQRLLISLLHFQNTRTVRLDDESR